MEEQNNQQFNKPIQSSKNIWLVVIIAVIITALIIGGTVYAWQRLNSQSMEQTLQRQITTLQNQINELQQAQLDQDLPDNDNDNLTTYTNNNLKYSIQYPESWKILELQGDLNQSILIGPNPELPGMIQGDTDETYINIHIGAVAISGRSVEQEIERFREVRADYSSEGIIKVANQNAYQFTNSGTDSMDVILVPHNGELYYIFYDSNKFIETQESISTFRFID